MAMVLTGDSRHERRASYNKPTFLRQLACGVRLRFFSAWRADWAHRQMNLDRLTIEICESAQGGSGDAILPPPAMTNLQNDGYCPAGPISLVNCRNGDKMIRRMFQSREGDDFVVRGSGTITIGMILALT